MPNAKDLLRSLAEAGVKFSVRDGRLCFQAPEGLAPEMTSQLHQLVQLAHRAQPSAASPLRRRAADARVPLTAVQLRIWRSKAEPRLSIRFCAVGVRIFGALNVALLRISINALVRRHETLRTRFVAIDGVPQQQIDEAWQDLLEEADLSHFPAEQRGAEVVRLSKALREEPVDLAIGPLFKASLIRLSANEHILVLAFDHMISDGVSEEIIDEELWDLYRRGARGEPLSLPPLPLQFGDYALWQEHTAEAWLEEHLSYWRARLTNAPATRLPWDESLTEVKDPRAASMELSFGAILTERLREMARCEHTLLPLVVLTLYLIEMRRWSGQSDLLCIFVSNGRIFPELQSMVGFLANQLYLRVTIDDHVSFRDLLEQVHREFSAAHEHLDFDRVPELIPGCTTELHFNWLPTYWKWTRRSASEERPVTDNLRIRRFPITVTWPFKFLTWFCDTADGINVTVVYRSDAFLPETIERFGYELRSLGAIFSEDPLANVASAMASLQVHQERQL